MEIRLAEKEDIKTILTLQTQIYRVSTPAQNAPQILGELLKADYCDVLVAKVDGKITGCALVFYLPNPAHGAPYALLEGLVVDKNQRHQGIGTALFEKAMELARARNCYKIIFTSGNERADAHKFYEKLGFKKWGVEFRKDLYIPTPGVE